MQKIGVHTTPVSSFSKTQPDVVYILKQIQYSAGHDLYLFFSPHEKFH